MNSMGTPQIPEISNITSPEMISIIKQTLISDNYNSHAVSASMAWSGANNCNFDLTVQGPLGYPIDIFYANLYDLEPYKSDYHPYEYIYYYYGAASRGGQYHFSGDAKGDSEISVEYISFDVPFPGSYTVGFSQYDATMACWFDTLTFLIKSGDDEISFSFPGVLFVCKGVFESDFCFFFVCLEFYETSFICGR